MGRRARGATRGARRLTVPRPLLLVGLSGAGKTTVAPHAAALLECGWCDLDERIAARAGRSIADIFAGDGEGRFRDLERTELMLALQEEPQVIATGAGWAAEPGNLALVAGSAFVIHLEIAPAEAARRLGKAADRPLLAGPGAGDLLGRLERQLAERARWYHLADMEIAVGEASAEAVAAGVVTIARQYAGW